MAKNTWLRGAALALIAAVAFTSLALTGCNKKVGAQESGSSDGGSTKATASNVKEAPASDFRYALTEDKSGVVINEYTGNGDKVAIPATIEGMPVTEIAFNCFGEQEVKEVVIPASVKIIRRWAFCDCIKLTTVNLPASIELIAEQAFYRCNELHNLIIPDSLSAVKFERQVFVSTKLPLATQARLKELGYTGGF